MAQRVHVVLEDDLDGSTAEETVTFGLDGVTYEIDVSSKNAAKLRDALSAYVAVARRSSARQGRRSSKRSGGPSASEIRDWARANGFQVSERGRVSSEVRTAYNAAH
ncbi:MAG: Lsr2 family protein [Propionibacteriales bacterium]|nr:Lsr2 family protein [Propionibacteriales bacterium]